MASKKKILVIDDELNVVNMLKMNLEAEGYDVITAFNGSEGLSRVHAGPPDLVICDVMMPEMDGFEVCRRIRQDTSMDTMPFILPGGRMQCTNLMILNISSKRHWI